MSVQEAETNQQPLTLDDLTYFELTNGAYCFVGNMEHILDDIEALGFQIYYVIGTSKSSTKSGSVTTHSYRPGVYKVINNMVGRAIIEANDDLDLTTITPKAWFGLPKIPHELIMKVDTFFRTVHTVHGTEAIVLLTFDPTFTDSSGWGVLVPEQSNTAGACDYVHESIVNEKPEHVVIVGSAHSHPGMSAYASPTDHGDQADFDGLHITHGWMKSKNGGATEFHIELQMGGAHFQFKPEEIFEDLPMAQPDEEIQEWAKKVKKKSGTMTGSTQSGSAGSTSSSGTKWTSNDNRASRVKLPANAPDISSNIVIGRLLTADERECPFCRTKLINSEIERRRCMACHQYVCLPNETLTEFLAAREASKVYSPDLDVSKGTNKPIYLWNRTKDGKDDDFILWHSASPGKD